MNTAISMSSTAIISNTIRNMNYNMDVLTATTKAAQMELLKKRMMRGEVVKFAYLKKDKSIRLAVGSLQENAVQANIAGTGIPKRFYGMFVYLDLEKMAWRGFKTENFIGIVD
ncbi:SH3 beta-barrel fold-containing protein [Methanobrevibacter sp.]|uniref:SH3 beta-barrel fold-containing protein n=1 Tax=Methanobrevibacter sp. TaxID=66852 RepID=UPI00386BF7BA